MNKPPLLISACLAGIRCRYNGSSVPFPLLEALEQAYSLVAVCPEQLGGLITPRSASERVNGRILTKEGEDVTHFFEAGAQEALRIALNHHCTTALLMERSPSCGVGFIYDGTFSSTLTEGNGVFAALLISHSFTLYTPTSAGLLL